MALTSLILSVVFVASVFSLKMTPEIESCISQAEGRMSGESDERVKTGVEQLIANIKSSNLIAAQKIVRENTVEDRTMVINKYLVDACGPLKTCFICPLELA